MADSEEMERHFNSATRLTRLTRRRWKVDGVFRAGNIIALQGRRCPSSLFFSRREIETSGVKTGPDNLPSSSNFAQRVGTLGPLHFTLVCRQLQTENILTHSTAFDAQSVNRVSIALLPRMAFHFDAQADSSDDGGAMDLSAWKAGAKRVSPAGGRAPVAPMMRSSVHQEADASVGVDVDLESSASPALLDFQDGRKRKRGSATRSPPPPAFRPINNLDRQSSAGRPELDIQSISSAGQSSGEDEGDQQQNQPQGVRKLVVRISRTEGDNRDEYEDFTNGSRRVRRVLWEVRPINRQVAYQVLFGDFHEEAVRFFLLLVLLSLRAFLGWRVLNKIAFGR
jgi:hypothetical protein